MKQLIWTAVVILSPGMMFGAQATGTPPAPAPAAAAAAAGESWKVTGEVQGTPVMMTCVLIEADHKLTGSCTGAAGDTTPRPLAGEVTEKGLTWAFDTEYEGNPITVAMSAAKNTEGSKMTGTMSVAPMGVDGTFSAVKQVKQL